MKTARWRDPDARPADRVTAVEVFFDVVFVFTLTQLTRTLEADLSFATAGRVLIMFGALWYMYGGYSWLTNHVPPHRPSQKLVLFAGMAGFFIAAIGIPRAFDETGMLFGVGYLIVIVVHLLLFSQSEAVAGVVRLVPYNLGGALLILASGLTEGTMKYALWVEGFALMTILPYLIPRYSWVAEARAFHVAAKHFVERHGLLVMIALGESVIAIGMGVDVTHLPATTVGLTVLALTLPGAMWWTYFSDYNAAQHALDRATDEARTLLAVNTYYFAHIPVLLGIVVAAAGIHVVVASPDQPAQWPAAIALGGGVALFLVGIACCRRCLSIGASMTRVIAAGAALATIPLGVMASGGWQLAALLGVMLDMLVMSKAPASDPSRA